MKNGMQLLQDPFSNKGTAFTTRERQELGLIGLLPTKVQTLNEQIKQAYEQYNAKVNDVEKRLFLSQIFNENRTLFYAILGAHLTEMMPIVYSPTVGETIEHYSELFVNPQEVSFLDIHHPENVADSLKNAANGRDIDMIVITDGEGILGIGDWGVQGADIIVGKLMVYTAAAGIDPRHVLPVVLDAGTNRESLLENDSYLGNRHERVRGDEYFSFIDQLVAEADQIFPNFYLHFEDFGRSTATKLLTRYQDRLATFNDDIQGTGIVVTAAVLSALKITGENLVDQTYITYGAGSAGVGIANRVLQEFINAGLIAEEARKHFYLVDRQGLLFDDDENLTPEQRPFARSRAEFAEAADLTTLEATVKAVNPTILVGTSGQAGHFTEEVVREMAAHAERPIILPLSNPTKLHEAIPEDVINWSEGRALVATGMPFEPVHYDGVTYHIGQANNAVVYPGIGLGVIASKANLLTENMLSASATALGELVDTSKVGSAILPSFEKLSEISTAVATAVAQAAIDDGVAQQQGDAKTLVENHQWHPVYGED
ncbi:malolactic enzyme [Weissella hellenica]|uniref:Malolactic enzyme n=1 Tax=Weissella hellenica TaxID=46256 RepID=A0A4Y4G336_WEIHE|nr:malolactic enzyme [Weissella hellenica]NKY66809.1 NAD-dependent malic enzyme [Weissella hellenica]GED36649.1 NAD-dependent malic enzyme [Weissella hellenica]SCB84978.1 malate dehydrogenase (oxaloacetate-decarboxylating) [Weissella hellenica]